MTIKLSDFILEQTISDSSITDIELECRNAEIDVMFAIMEAEYKQFQMNYFTEAVTTAPPPPPPNQTVIASTVNPGKQQTTNTTSNGIPESLKNTVEPAKAQQNQPSFGQKLYDKAFESGHNYVASQTVGSPQTIFGIIVSMLKLMLKNLQVLLNQIIGVLEPIALFKRRKKSTNDVELNDEQKKIVGKIKAKVDGRMRMIGLYAAAALFVVGILKDMTNIALDYKKIMAKISQNESQASVIFNQANNIAYVQHDESFDTSLDYLASIKSSKGFADISHQLSEIESGMNSIDQNTQIDKTYESRISAALKKYYDSTYRSVRTLDAQTSQLIRQFSIALSKKSYTKPVNMSNMDIETVG